MPDRRAVRVRRSEKQWIEILKRFESSGLGSKEFCRREDVSPSSFQRWRRRLGPVSTAEFVELVPASTPSTPLPSWSLDVALPNGVCLRFRG
jgi:transposase-like protein